MSDRERGERVTRRAVLKGTNKNKREGEKERTSQLLERQNDGKGQGTNAVVSAAAFEECQWLKRSR